MNLRLGIYDLFARVVPGGFYLLAFAQLARVFGWIELNWEILREVGILPSFILLFVAYIVGTAMLRIGSAWLDLIQKRDTDHRLLESFKEKYSDRWVIDFQASDWPILRSYLYVHHPVVAEEADKFNALSIMLRNLSLGFALLTVSEVVEFFRTGNWIFLVIASLLLFLSYQLAVQGRKQSGWFYTYIYEAILASRLNLEERVRPVKKTSRRKRENERDNAG